MTVTGVEVFIQSLCVIVALGIVVVLVWPERKDGG